MYFRRSRNRVDLILRYNTESIALIDIITTLIAARSSGAIHDLKIHHYMTFDTRKNLHTTEKCCFINVQYCPLTINLFYSQK